MIELSKVNNIDGLITLINQYTQNFPKHIFDYQYKRLTYITDLNMLKIFIQNYKGLFDGYVTFNQDDKNNFSLYRDNVKILEFQDVNK